MLLSDLYFAVEWDIRKLSFVSFIASVPHIMSNMFLHVSIIKSQFGSNGSDTDDAAAPAASPFLATRKHKLSISEGAAGVEHSGTAAARRSICSPHSLT